MGQFCQNEKDLVTLMEQSVHKYMATDCSIKYHRSFHSGKIGPSLARYYTLASVCCPYTKTLGDTDCTAKTKTFIYVHIRQ